MSHDISAGWPASPEEITARGKALFAAERRRIRLDGWFRIKEIRQASAGRYAELPPELQAAMLLQEIAANLPIEIDDQAIFAGTQRDAFARSYALINPTFQVESFSGYCDPTAVYNDIEPSTDLTPPITPERIREIRAADQDSDYVRALGEAYRKCEPFTAEVAFFVEQVTGHVIPDLRPAIAFGINSLIAGLEEKISSETDQLRRINYQAMQEALEAVLILAGRYAACARQMAGQAGPERAAELQLLAGTLDRIPAQGAASLYEAIQSFMLLWQVMCLEQSPNPFAFSVGNADRIFEPYRQKTNLDRAASAALFKHLLVFFNVGDRSWAISQNILVGGKNTAGADLSNESTYALLDAYYDMNLPQPILSVKLHQNTPAALYEAMGRFFFTPGCLTPSLFNDDSLFQVLEQSGVRQEDLADYSIAGCQEPLIMGRDNGNTTNSWLNLAKILELTLNNGLSSITGNRIQAADQFIDPASRLQNIRQLFYQNLRFYARAMANSANEATRALSLLPVPFLSSMMGGLDSGYDMRDTRHQGTRYNGSGCLIHGLAVVADSFAAIDHLLAERPQDSGRLLAALLNDFAGAADLRQFLLDSPKFGNHIESVDDEARDVASQVAAIVAGLRNDLGNPFRVDFSTPSTHLLYGYWVGATPDGRRARDMLNYGTDPLHGDANNGLGFRTLSAFRLPYALMNGGYASHFGIDPKYFKGSSLEAKGMEFRDRVIRPLFFNPANRELAPYYLYVNVTTADILRKVLANPKKYAPQGVYIMRIHGTFVNFLDLSPAIQQDIITRLDPASTAV